MALLHGRVHGLPVWSGKTASQGIRNLSEVKPTSLFALSSFHSFCAYFLVQAIYFLPVRIEQLEGWWGKGLYTFFYLFAYSYSLIHKLASKEEASFTSSLVSPRLSS